MTLQSLLTLVLRFMHGDLQSRRLNVLVKSLLLALYFEAVALIFFPLEQTFNSDAATTIIWSTILVAALFFGKKGAWVTLPPLLAFSLVFNRYYHWGVFLDLATGTFYVLAFTGMALFVGYIKELAERAHFVSKDRAQKQHELAKKRYELEKTKKVTKEKAAFLDVAAHQLRTPMSGIHWSLSMAAAGDFGQASPEVGSLLNKANEAVERGIVVVNSLLDLTRVEAEKSAYLLQPIDLARFVQEVVATVEADATKNHVTIEVVAPGRPLSTVLADREKMATAVHHLLDNAIRYNRRHGKVRVKFSEDDEGVSLLVKDTGLGIPHQDQPNIFSKFYRGANVVDLPNPGAGLGLFLAKEIVTEHHGQISFGSEEGAGSTFTIRLPKADLAALKTTTQ